jgi:hypothetical protein
MDLRSPISLERFQLDPSIKIIKKEGHRAQKIDIEPKPLKIP